MGPVVLLSTSQRKPEVKGAPAQGASFHPSGPRGSPWLKKWAQSSLPRLLLGSDGSKPFQVRGPPVTLTKPKGSLKASLAMSLKPIQGALVESEAARASLFSDALSITAR